MARIYDPVKKRYVDVSEIAPVSAERLAELNNLDEDDTSFSAPTWLKSGALKEGVNVGNAIKTVLATGRDVATNMYSGILGIGEGVIDASATYYGKIADIIGADGVRDKLTEFVAKDIVNEDAIAEKMTSFTIANLVSDKKDSVLGEKTVGVAKSGGQLLGTAALQAAGIPWWLTTGLTSFGGESENALRNNATLNQAVTSGLITAGAEVLTEKIGGIKFGGKVATDALKTTIATTLSSKIAQTVATLGIDMAGEGVEEVLSGAISALGKKLTYEKGKDFSEIFPTEEAWDSFIGGALLSGVSSGASVIESKSEDRNFATGLNDIEAKVVKQIYNERVGSNSSLSTKNAVYDKVIKDVEEGRVSTDDIERILGGEQYEAYKKMSTTKKRKIEALESKIKELVKTPKDEFTVEQSEALEKAREELRELTESTQSKDLKSKLSKSVSDMVKGTKLYESYAEVERKHSQYTADANREYTKKENEIIKKAIDSGVINNTRAAHEFVDLVAKAHDMTGIDFDFSDTKRLAESGYAIEGATVNGVYDNGKIILNMNSRKTLNTVLGHEIAHALKGSELYDVLKNTAFEYARSKGTLNKLLESTKKLYQGVDGVNIEDEMLSDMIGDYIFEDSDFVESLFTNNRNVFQKVYDEIKHLYRLAAAGSREARELERVKNIFEKTLRSMKQETGNVAKDIGGKPIDKSRITSNEADNSYSISKSKEIEESQSAYLSEHKNHITDTANGIMGKDVYYEAPIKTAMNAPVAQSIKIANGTRVRANDRGNVGTVVGYDEKSGKYSVRFTNKNGNTATVRLDRNVLTPLMMKKDVSAAAREKATRLENEMESLITARAEAEMSYNDKIEGLTFAYESKENKNTKTANDLLISIENQTRIKEDVLASYDRKIASLRERIDKINYENSQPVSEEIAEVTTRTRSHENARKRGAWSYIKETLDKGMVFETLSKAFNNRELEARWNSIRYARRAAQNFMTKGVAKDGVQVKSLSDIRREVGEANEQDFFEYMYNLLNVDRMTLWERFGIDNKAVFGESVTADVSREIVSELEAMHPEFKTYAEDVYAYTAELRRMMVESGLISQETADMWAEMYPHYVPIARSVKAEDNGAANKSDNVSVGSPVKSATGGTSSMYSLFGTLAEYTSQTFSAAARNRFGVELKNTLGVDTVISESENDDIDEILSGIKNTDELLTAGDNEHLPTFTIFENGERTTFGITDEMYDALKPISEKMSYTNKALNSLSTWHKGLLTTYNPVFGFRNAIKDAQDILINSQHAARTYANLPRAYNEIIHNGKYLQEYRSIVGGEEIFYDMSKGEFLDKQTGMPLKIINSVNEAIELAPRLAEYIASREMGRSMDVAALDAARVTTNFSAGGDLVKLLDRNGFTFLNASVQGAVQQARNIQEAKVNGLKGWISLATRYAIAGLPAILLNALLWDDDEEYEELSDYVKQNYYIVAKKEDGTFVRIPKGRTVAVIQDALTQTINSATGKDEFDLNSFLELAINNLAPNNPLQNNVFAPISQTIANKTWYGEELVPQRLEKLPAEEQYDESTDTLSRWIGEKTGLSPYKVNYLLDQYTGALGDVVLPALTPEVERGAGNYFSAPFIDTFTTNSVMNNKNAGEFYETLDTYTVNANSSKASDEDKVRYKFMSNANQSLSELYKAKREIQASDEYDDETKYALVYELQGQINKAAREAMESVKNAVVNESYASVGNVEYRKDANGEWLKVSESQKLKQEAFSRKTGQSASEYWQRENDKNNALEKSIGADYYEEYIADISDISSDKDENGDTISGSRKTKVGDYIRSLDIDSGKKAILFRIAYPGDDTYNKAIVKYLKERDDITRNELILTLEALGMTVGKDGKVRW